MNVQNSLMAFPSVPAPENTRYVWKIMILCVIDNKEVVRYGELSRSIHGITNTMLANSLKELEADGLVKRKQYNEIPVRVEYNLTEKTKSLIPILLELKKWGEDNL